jgi:phospholipid/cholesterol/gamma-HCH transport system substrate-binding protein
MNVRPKGFRGHVATVLLAGLIALAFAGAILYQAGVFSAFQNRYEVQALVPTVASLGSGASVRIGGVPVGRVTKVERQGLGARISMDLEARHAPLPQDTRVAVRLRTLIGENYVELDPGRSTTTLRSGATLPMAAAEDYVEVDQVLSVLRGRTRERARALMRSTGAALDGHGGQLNSIVGDASAAISDGFSPLGDVLYQDRQRLAGFVDNLGTLARAVGNRGDSIRRLAGQARVSFQALAAQDRSVSALLRDLPGTLEQVQATTGTLRTVSRRASPVLADLGVALTQLKPAVAHLGPAASQGTTLVRQLGAAAPRLEKTLRAAEAVSAPATKALPQLKAVLCQVNPMLRYLAPYRDDAVAVLSGLGSTVNYYDAVGHAGRVSPTIGEDTLVALPQSVASAANTLIQAGLLSTVRQFGYNAYPPPHAGGTTELGNRASGPVDSGKAGVHFDHVLADC